MNNRLPAAIACLAGCAACVQGQATQRAAFVANNGNAEGSVTSYTFSPEGVPQFVARLITTGAGGTNAYAIALTPDGRFLATTHATAAATERISIMRVNADATLTAAGAFTTPDSPLAAVWLANDVLAVTLTSTGAPNKVITYRYDAAIPSLTEIERYDTGGFTGYLGATPSRRYLYAQDSPLGGGVYTLVGFLVNQDGTLTNIGTTVTSPVYALGPGISADGTRLYGGGGISSGSNKVVGFFIDPGTGALSPMPNSPFTVSAASPSPKQVVESRDGRFAFVAHGSSSEVRSFSISPLDGTLTDVGFAIDFGIQGDLGTIATVGNWLLVTKTYSSPNTGLSCYTINQDGTFTINGAQVSTQGSLPRGIATWDPPAPPCYANCDQSTTPPVLNIQDFTCFINRFSAGETYANCDGSTIPPALNIADFGCFLNRFSAGCS